MCTTSNKTNLQQIFRLIFTFSWQNSTFFRSSDFILVFVIMLPTFAQFVQSRTNTKTLLFRYEFQIRIGIQQKKRVRERDRGRGIERETLLLNHSMCSFSYVNAYLFTFLWFKYGFSILGVS